MSLEEERKVMKVRNHILHRHHVYRTTESHLEEEKDENETILRIHHVNEVSPTLVSLSIFIPLSSLHLIKNLLSLSRLSI